MFLPWLASDSSTAMDNYVHVNTQRYNGPPEAHEIRVASRVAVKDLVSRALALLNETERSQVLFYGQGATINKAITCAEVVKRKHPEIHQITSIDYDCINEFWKPKDSDSGLDDLKIERKIPCIRILLSFPELDPSTPGYQPPKAAATPKPAKKGGRRKRKA